MRISVARKEWSRYRKGLTNKLRILNIDQLPPASKSWIRRKIITFDASEETLRSFLCTCPDVNECDCENPDGVGVAHCSNYCPVHNNWPQSYDDCPVHGQLSPIPFSNAQEKERENILTEYARWEKQLFLPLPA